VLAVVPEGALMEELTDFLGELKERGAELIVISAYERALSLAQTPLKIPAGIPEWVSPIAAVVPGQLLALGLTLAKGYNIDQPRNIHKVTKTE
jgi:glucosamine--fructose-6-phosphate aminotransferase (isomerizing)